MRDEPTNFLRPAKTAAAAALALCLCFGWGPLSVRVGAQGDLTGGVGAFASQPKPNRVEKIKRPVYKRPEGPRVSPNDRLLEAASLGNVGAFDALLKGGAVVNTKA